MIREVEIMGYQAQPIRASQIQCGVTVTRLHGGERQLQMFLSDRLKMNMFRTVWLSPKPRLAQISIQPIISYPTTIVEKLTKGGWQLCDIDIIITPTFKDDRRD
jgi:hypothetical protein